MVWLGDFWRLPDLFEWLIFRGVPRLKLCTEIFTRQLLGHFPDAAKLATVAIVLFEEFEELILVHIIEIVMLFGDLEIV